MSIKKIISNLVADKYNLSKCTTANIYFISGGEGSIMQADLLLEVDSDIDFDEYLLFVSDITFLQENGFNCTVTIQQYNLLFSISNIKMEENKNIRIIIVGDYDGSDEQIEKIKSINEQMEGIAKIVTVEQAVDDYGITDSEDIIELNKVKMVENTADYIKKMEVLKDKYKRNVGNYPSVNRIRGKRNTPPSKKKKNNRSKMQKASRRRNRK